MGKRIHQAGFSAGFRRNARDLYPTPPAAVQSLLPFLPATFRYSEPCVGGGALIRSITAARPEGAGLCVYTCDINPIDWIARYAETRDCLTVSETECNKWNIQLFITNPPWPRKGGRGKPTTEIIRHLSGLRPSWFLLSADFAHNGYAAELLDYCSHIVSVGRVRWIEGTDNDGVDNAAWYRFDRRAHVRVPWFYSSRDWFAHGLVVIYDPISY